MQNEPPIDEENALLGRWNTDFKPSDYVTLATVTGTFASQTQRQTLLQQTAYHYQNRQEIAVVFYGAMLKRMFETSDPDFVQQGYIVGIKFDWYAENGQLRLNAEGIDEKGTPLTGEPIPVASKLNLYDAVRSSSVTQSFSFNVNTLLQLLGFEGTLPTHPQNNLVLRPVIVNIPNEGAYFSLDAALNTGTTADGAYGPPCPPFCYPRRNV